MEDEEIKIKAVNKRYKRMKTALGWSALIATIGDRAIASAMIGHMRTGINVLLFGVIALVIFYWMKGPILTADTSHFAWRGRSPWLW
ncbi:MAG: hypothetical protein AB7L36_14840, partial [Sphingomonadaceae bacterium]